MEGVPAMNLTRYRLTYAVALDGETPATTRSFDVGTEDVQAIEVTGGGIIVRREPARRDLMFTSTGYGWIRREKTK
jgi:hypothetical protein